jgi:hypothetical protein
MRKYSRSVVISSMILTLASVFTASAQTAKGKATSEDIPGHLKYYGYAAVSYCAHDLHDSKLGNTDYITEVDSWTNIAEMCVHDPQQLITGDLDQMVQNGIGAVLLVGPLFFESGHKTALSGAPAQVLRADYRARWKAFVHKNGLTRRTTGLAAFYVAAEPTWNGVSYADLKTATDSIKVDFPDTPTLIIEAYQALNNLVVPKSMNWIGFARYAIPNPATDIGYLADLAELRSKKSSPAQKILLVMEGTWHPEYGAGGFASADMAQVAASYYRLAQTQSDVIGILVYTWPDGADTPQELGSRELPAGALAEQKHIGKTITGK